MKCTLETNSCTKELYDGAAGCICLEHGADASNDVRVFLAGKDGRQSMLDQEKVNNPSIYENTIPSGFSGGFFVYNALGKQEIFFADPNVIQLFECTDIADLRQLTGNSFRGMVYPEDLDQVESNILAQTFESGKRHDHKVSGLRRV